VHQNYKQAIIESDDTGTVMLNRKSTPWLPGRCVLSFSAAAFSC
jgi:hypothetical protein